MASTYLTYTQQSPSTAEAQKFTLSMWVKKYSNGANLGLYGNTYSDIHRGFIYFNTSDALQYFDSNGVDYTTTRLFRDTNAWYHIVVAVDTTLSSSSDRIKFYVNGIRETSFSTTSAPNQNDTLKLMNTTNTPNMGRIVKSGTSYYLNGVMSHVHFTQGYTYDATPFGETDATTGEWKIKTDVSVTYGTNGFFILKDGNSVTDQSGNGNNFTVSGGTLTNTEDNPSNVFATFNPLFPQAQYGTYTNGNTSVVGNNNTFASRTNSTLAASSGKYYMEFKIIDVQGSSYPGVGMISTENAIADGQIGGASESVSYRAGGTVLTNGSTTATINSYTDNDIIGVAMDLDNGAVYFSKNGTYQNSGDPTSGASKTGSLYSFTPSDTYHFACTAYQADSELSANFGNGYFGTTAVSSAGTNTSGNGIFEYDVPTGYTALSTKGLNL